MCMHASVSACVCSVVCVCMHVCLCVCGIYVCARAGTDI